MGLSGKVPKARAGASNKTKGTRRKAEAARLTEAIEAVWDSVDGSYTLTTTTFSGRRVAAYGPASSQTTNTEGTMANTEYPMTDCSECKKWKNKSQVYHDTYHVKDLEVYKLEKKKTAMATGASISMLF